MGISQYILVAEQDEGLCVSFRSPCSFLSCPQWTSCCWIWWWPDLPPVSVQTLWRTEKHCSVQGFWSCPCLSRSCCPCISCPYCSCCPSIPCPNCPCCSRLSCPNCPCCSRLPCPNCPRCSSLPRPCCQGIC